MPGEEDHGTKHVEDKKKNSDKTPQRYMKKTTLTILLGILNVFLLVILIFIAVFFSKDKSQKVVIHPSQTFCLPCEDISVHPDDDPINFRSFVQRDELGKQICCADHGQNMDKLMQLYVDRKHAIKSSEQNTAELETACNKTVDEFSPQVMAKVAGIQGTTPGSNGGFSTVQWQASTTQPDVIRFLRNVTYNSDTGEFGILNPGYYYVYSQVTLKLDSSSQQSSATSLCFNIYKMSGGMTEKLLENSRTQCKFQGDSSMSTSYIGAVFNLNKDDRLLVKVSDPKVIDRTESKSFFGLHFI